MYQLKIFTVFCLFLFLNLFGMHSGRLSKRDILISFYYADDHLECFSHKGLAAGESLGPYISVNREFFLSKYMLRVGYRKPISVVEDCVEGREVFLYHTTDIVVKCGFTTCHNRDCVEKCRIYYILLFLKESLDDSRNTVQVFRMGESDPFFTTKASDEVVFYKTYKLLGREILLLAYNCKVELFDLSQGVVLNRIITFGDVAKSGVLAQAGNLVFFVDRIFKVIEVGEEPELLLHRSFTSSIHRLSLMLRYLAVTLCAPRKDHAIIKLFDVKRFYPDLGEIRVGLRDKIGFRGKLHDTYFFVLDRSETEIKAYSLNVHSFDFSVPLFEKRFDAQIKCFDVRFDEGDYLVSVDLRDGRRYRYELE